LQKALGRSDSWHNFESSLVMVRPDGHGETHTADIEGLTVAGALLPSARARDHTGFLERNLDRIRCRVRCDFYVLEDRGCDAASLRLKPEPEPLDHSANHRAATEYFDFG